LDYFNDVLNFSGPSSFNPFRSLWRSEKAFSDRLNSVVIMLSPPADSIHDVIGPTRVGVFQLKRLWRVARPHFAAK